MAISLLAVTMALTGCSRRDDDSSDDSTSTIWGLRMTAIESMTGLTYVDASVDAADLGVDDAAVVYVINRYPDYYVDTDGDIDPMYNVVVTKYHVDLAIAGYSPFTFQRSIYMEIPASTTDETVSLNAIVVPAILKSQIATIVDAEGGLVEAAATIRLEGEFGSGEDAWTTGRVQVRITSQSAL